ncbi:M23 family peptidase [Streptomyces sp. NPDC017936]|uniref:M23 family peptidase n=1 Tax=Streptomyces sp. NPDC017936 TaxID=3365016 RepID=UPI0037958791
MRAVGGQRDHLSRTSPPGAPHLTTAEASARDPSGAERVVGDHAALDLGDGAHALHAPLRRGSLTVREGDRVGAGQPPARCGDSGSPTEPHPHFPLTDGPAPDTARGIPFTGRGLGAPRNGEILETPPAVPRRA